jgi:hypothetical protein
MIAKILRGEKVEIPSCYQGKRGIITNKKRGDWTTRMRGAPQRL